MKGGFMDLIKIGKFIQELRKTKKLTQVQLAQRLGVSEKTISKWECGNGFPDTSLMLPLCKELDITANELLSGRLLSSEDYQSSAEENILLLKDNLEKSNKHLLTLEWVLGGISLIFLLSMACIVSYAPLATHWRIILLVIGFFQLVVAVIFGIKIETEAGFYECGHCHHRYIPKYSQVLWAMHFGSTRYMKCPKCHKRSWHRKKINKD